MNRGGYTIKARGTNEYTNNTQRVSVKSVRPARYTHKKYRTDIRHVIVRTPNLHRRLSLLV